MVRAAGYDPARLSTLPSKGNVSSCSTMLALLFTALTPPLAPFPVSYYRLFVAPRRYVKQCFFGTARSILRFKYANLSAFIDGVSRVEDFNLSNGASSRIRTYDPLLPRKMR